MLSRHRPEHAFTGIHQHDPRFVRIKLFEGIVECPTHQLRDRSSHLAATGAGSNNHYGLEKLTCAWIRCLLRLFHGHQQAPTDLFGVLQDLHRRRKGAPIVVAKKGAAGSGGQHQMVVAVGLSVEDDLFPFGMDVRHFAEQDLHIALLANQLTQRCCDIAAGNQARRNLVQKGLEKIEVALVDQRDAHVRLGQSFAGVDAGESPTDDHHVRHIAQAFLRWLQLQEEMGTGHGSATAI